MMNLISIAAAAAPAAEKGNGGFLPLLGPIIIFGVMIFFMIRSQKKQAQKRQQMLERIKKGDQVVTAGGIYAKVIEVKDKTFVVEIADKVNVEISKSGVNGVFNEEQTAAK
jgi:preprotein translocase subunit YajC